MLIKYNNYTVQPVSIQKHLSARNADCAENFAACRAPKTGGEDSALANFFRQVEKKLAPPTAEGQRGKLLPFDRSTRKLKTLKEISNEILARMNGEPDAAGKPFPIIKAKTSAAIYTYRSKADITHYDLPPIAVNQ